MCCLKLTSKRLEGRAWCDSALRPPPAASRPGWGAAAGEPPDSSFASTPPLLWPLPLPAPDDQASRRVAEKHPVPSGQTQPVWLLAPRHRGTLRVLPEPFASALSNSAASSHMHLFKLKLNSVKLKIELAAPGTVQVLHRPRCPRHRKMWTEDTPRPEVLLQAVCAPPHRR